MCVCVGNSDWLSIIKLGYDEGINSYDNINTVK